MLEFKVTSTSHAEVKAKLSTAQSLPFEEWLNSNFQSARKNPEVNIKSVLINIDFVNAPEDLINILGRILKKYKILKVVLSADFRGAVAKIECIANMFKSAGVQTLGLYKFFYGSRESFLELIKLSGIKSLCLDFDTANFLPREMIPYLNKISNLSLRIVFRKLLAKPGKSEIPALQELEDNCFQRTIRCFYDINHMNYFVNFLTLGRFEFLDLSNNNLGDLPEDIWDNFCVTLSKSFVRKIDVTGNDLNSERLAQLEGVLKKNRPKLFLLEKGLQKSVIYNMKQTFLMSTVAGDPNKPEEKYLILKDKTQEDKPILKGSVKPSLADLIDFEMIPDFRY